MCVRIDRVQPVLSFGQRVFGIFFARHVSQGARKNDRPVRFPPRHHRVAQPAHAIHAVADVIILLYASQRPRRLLQLREVPRMILIRRSHPREEHYSVLACTLCWKIEQPRQRLVDRPVNIVAVGRTPRFGQRDTGV